MDSALFALGHIKYRRFLAGFCVCENWRKLREHGEFAIFLGKFRFEFGNGPRDSQRRIIPANSTIMGRRVVVVDLVENFGLRLQRAKSMWKPGRNENLIPILRA